MRLCVHHLLTTDATTSVHAGTMMVRHDAETLNPKVVEPRHTRHQSLQLPVNEAVVHSTSPACLGQLPAIRRATYHVSLGALFIA